MPTLTVPSSRRSILTGRLHSSARFSAVSGRLSLVPWETDYGKLEIMADVYLNYLAQVFNLPDDDYVKTRLEFGSDSADRDSLMTAEEKEIISANK